MRSLLRSLLRTLHSFPVLLLLCGLLRGQLCPLQVSLLVLSERGLWPGRRVRLLQGDVLALLLRGLQRVRLKLLGPQRWLGRLKLLELLRWSLR